MVFLKTLLSVAVLATIVAATDPSSLEPAKGCSPINFEPVLEGVRLVIVSIVQGIITIVKHHVGVIAALLGDIWGIITSINVACVLKTVVSVFANVGYIIECLIGSIKSACEGIFQNSNPLGL